MSPTRIYQREAQDDLPLSEESGADAATREEHHPNDSMLMALSRQWGKTPWYLSSLGVHCLILALMLLFAPAPRQPAPPALTLVSALEVPEEMIELRKEQKPEDTTPDETTVNETSLNTIEINTQAPPLEMAAADDSAPEDVTSFDDSSAGDAPVLALSGGKTPGGASQFKGFSTRGGSKKQQQLRRNGGDKYSEAALNEGLKWLARHQGEDGSWRLFPQEKYFSGRFGFPHEAHLPVHSDKDGMRREWCMNKIRIPYNMTLAVELDHADDHIYVSINNVKSGPYPDAEGHADAQWKGSFNVKKGDTFRIQIVSTCVGMIHAVGRYHDAKFDAPALRDRAPYFRTEAGQTALCTLAFLGTGNTSRVGKYRQTVRKAQEYMLNFSYEEFGTKLPAPVAFEAPIMIMALVELYGMDNAAEIRNKVQQLVDMGVKYQLPNGGWPENMAIDKTGSWHNTAWWLCALKSARMAGLSVPEEVFTRAMTSLRACLELEPGSNNRYAAIRDRTQSGYPRADASADSRLALSMVVQLLQSLDGADLEDKMVRGICEVLVRDGTDRDGRWDWPGANMGYDLSGLLTALPEFFEAPGAADEGKRSNPDYSSFFNRAVDGFPAGLWGKAGYVERFGSLYHANTLRPVKPFYSGCFWYWTGNSLSRLGNRTSYWKAWNNNFKPYLLYTQAKGGAWPDILVSDPAIRNDLEKGDINGSWPGVFLRDGCEPFTDLDQTGATAFNCLMLEVYYRY